MWPTSSARLIRQLLKTLTLSRNLRLDEIAKRRGSSRLWTESMQINIHPHQNIPTLINTTPAEGQRTARRHRQRARILELQDQGQSELRNLAIEQLSSILATLVTQDRESA